VDQVLNQALPGEWVIFTLLALLFAGFAEIGFRLGWHLHPTKDAASKDLRGGIQTARLGLVGLLLGFTFAMAVGRYELRHDLAVKEANAIGTTFLRASFLPDAHRVPVEDLLRRYVDLRLRYQPVAGDPVQLAEGLRLSAGIQRQLWEQAVASARETPTPIVATFINALNETIDTEAERLAAARNTVPGAVWLLLLAVASLGVSDEHLRRGRRPRALGVQQHRLSRARGRRDRAGVRSRPPETRVHHHQPGAARRPAASDPANGTLSVRAPGIRPRYSPEARGTSGHRQRAGGTNRFHSPSG
jgi:hypothetical protein